MLSRSVRRVSRLPLSCALIGALTFGLNSSPAATWMWDGITGAWGTGVNWDVNTAPISAADTSLVFGGSGTGYTSTHDLVSPFDLNQLTFQNGVSSPVELTGNALRFINNITPPTIQQNGSGNVILNLPIVSNAPLTWSGTGTGIAAIKGVLSGSGAMNFTGGHWQLQNSQNTFSGGINIATGAVVEILPQSGATTITRGAATYLGSNVVTNTVSIDGGTLKLTTNGLTNAAGTGGHMAFGAGFPLKFGVNGGTLDLRNGNPDSAGAHAGTIGYHSGIAVQTGGDFALDLSNTATAVLQFNGGVVGLSSLLAPQSGDWDVTGNVLRIRQPTGTGPLRIELSNGAMSRAGTGTGNEPTLQMPVTYRGVAGGDPTSGPQGIENSGITRMTGRLLVNQSLVRHVGGLTFEDAMQVMAGNGAAGLFGNITLAGSAGSHPATVTFSGRATGTKLMPDVVDPKFSTPGQHVLWIGGAGTDTLTVENGAIGILDARIRMDQNVHHGVLLNGRAILQGGGILRVAQSLSSFTPNLAVNPSNVGDIILRSPIEGQGTTANEAILDLRLPAPESAGTIATGIPKPISNSEPGNNERPFGGMVAETGHQIIVNGTGFGGLRVVASARPDALFSNTGAVGGASIVDPTSNLTKINGYLTAPRLFNVTGSGGYLTAAPTGQTWIFPMGGEWGNLIPVGLRVINHHPAGTDVSFGMVTGFQHNVAIDGDATLDLGPSLFTFGPSSTAPGIGTVHGNGTVVASGGLTVAAGGRIAPGMSDVGTLTVQTSQMNLLGSLEIDANAATADLLRVIGNLVLGANSQLVVPGTTVLASRGYKIAEVASRTGTFSGTIGLPASYALDYSRPDEVWLKYTGGQQLTWTGTNSNNWDQLTQNWSGPSAFANADDVFFDDSAPENRRSVTVSGGDVAPNEITVNTSGTYSLISFPGSAITGFGQLIKNGPGTLVLSGPATFEGGLTINAGSVQTALSNSIPDFGKVRVAAGAQLNLTGTETIQHLIVSGSVSSTGVLTVGALNLQNATAFSAPLELHGDVLKSGAPLTLPLSVSLGGAVRTIQVETGTAPDLTLSGVVSNGGLRKTGAGTLHLNALNNFAGGVQIVAGIVGTTLPSALPANGPVTIGSSGTLQLNGHAQSIGALDHTGILQLGGALLTVASLQGTGGSIDLGNGTLTAAQTSVTRFDGAISGAGSVMKSGSGSLGLGGANTFAGGISVQEGSLRILRPQASGSGVISVDSGGALVVAVPSDLVTVSVPIFLNGGTLGSRLVGQMSASASNVTAATGTTSTILIADPDNPSVSSEIILDGALRGSGNLIVRASTNNPNADNGPGFRLRGGGASDFNGTITVENRAKFELQRSAAGTSAPMGSGKLVMVAGTFASDRSGTYSQLNLRNNSTSHTTFGNDVEITGSGLVNFGPVSTGGVAPTGSRIMMGNLRIGAGQIAAVNKNLPPPTDPQPIQVVHFSSVTLTGGDATFSPKTPGFGFSDFPELILGPISETSPGSGIIMDGETKLILMGGNSYTGTTRVNRGTTLLGGEAALPANSALLMEGGIIDFQNGSNLSFSQTVRSLSGSSGTVTNTGSMRDFVIDQDVNTTFEGSIEGNLNLVKRGNGILQLVGDNTHDGMTTVAGGTLSVSGDFVQGGIESAVTVEDGAMLKGYGIVGALTVASGGRVAPGNSAGILATTGDITLHGGSLLEFEMNGSMLGSGYDQLDLNGNLILSGLVTLDLQLGFDPADHVDEFTLILNDGVEPIVGAGRFIYGPDVLQNGQQFSVSNAFFSQAFEIRYDGNDGNDVVLLAIPEPSSAVLLLGGLACLVRRRRR